MSWNAKLNHPTEKKSGFSGKEQNPNYSHIKSRIDTGLTPRGQKRILPGHSCLQLSSRVSKQSPCTSSQSVISTPGKNLLKAMEKRHGNRGIGDGEATEYLKEDTMELEPIPCASSSPRKSFKEREEDWNQNIREMMQIKDDLMEAMKKKYEKEIREQKVRQGATVKKAIEAIRMWQDKFETLMDFNYATSYSTVEMYDLFSRVKRYVRATKRLHGQNTLLRDALKVMRGKLVAAEERLSKTTGNDSGEKSGIEEVISECDKSLQILEENESNSTEQEESQEEENAEDNNMILHQEIIQLRQYISYLENELKMNKENVTDEMKTIGIITNKLEEREEELENIREQFSIAKKFSREQAEARDEEIQFLRQQAEKNDADLVRLQENITELQMENEALRENDDKVLMLELEVTELQSLLKHNEALMKRREDEISNLEKNLEQCNEDLAKQKQLINDLDIELHSAKSNVKLLKEQLDASGNLQVETRRKIGELKVEVKVREHEITHRLKSIEQLKKEHEDLAELLKGARAKLEQKDIEYEKRSQRLCETTKDIYRIYNDTVDKKTTLEAENKKIKDLLLTFENQIASAQEQIKNMEEHQEKEQRLNSLKIDQQSSLISDLKAELAEAKRKKTLAERFLPRKAK